LKVSVQRCRTAFLLLAWAVVSGAGAASPSGDSPQVLVDELEAFPHALSIARKQEVVRDHEIGLGPIQKSMGAWVFRDSVRMDGELQRLTWQIVDGFTSREVLQRLEQSLSRQESATRLFGCDGRACGSGSQWANRVFGQRLLYGRADDQSYRVYAVQTTGAAYRVLLYSGARSSDRQYLHLDILEVNPEVDEGRL
tara:strand:+ start:6731 stop:7318 length:588 start_codon:yes stop_codon:yes gene_type:complete